ncbi:MAG TPA: lysophospholipid acyltransferase family protein [Candidatus Binatia bacterium]|nr:lysophospholipid acyltransferase family protein [Candidatus Binatia bacterium]
MLRSLAGYWRVFGTGLGFLAVGLGGVLVFPVINVFVWRQERRAEIARDLIGLTFRCIVRSMQAMGVFRYEVNGLEKLQRRGLLILANHPTLIDIVFLIAFVKRANCIVKSALWRNPFTHSTVRAAGYIRNDDDGSRLINDCIAAVRAGNNLIIFPEGTRTPADGSLALKRGAANIAIRGLHNITPVRIRCAPPMLSKEVSWWRLPSCPSYFQIQIGEDIEVRPFVAAAESDVLAARHLTEHLRDYFSEKKYSHASL